MPRKKKCKKTESCIFDPAHSGKCAVGCGKCQGTGIIEVLRRGEISDWHKCPVCRGRGWEDVKGKGSR